MRGRVLEIAPMQGEEASPEEGFRCEPELDHGRQAACWRQAHEGSGTVKQTERGDGVQEEDADADEGVRCC